jgi:hypothetical protein
MPHLDGPAYEPTVLVYSIGVTIIEFTNKTQTLKLLLENNSLHFFSDKAYLEYMHGIKDYGIDCIFARFEFQDGRVVGVSNCSIINL